MKLIIDIDEEQFKDIKRIAIVQMELNHYTTAEQIIAKGKVVPDNLQGDLISREALKKALIEAHINRVLTFDIATFNCVMNTIDNAQTIDLDERDNDAFETGYIKGLCENRPHGKWITNYESQFFNPGRSCSLCNKTVEFSENFCPNCGADMRDNNNG